MCYETDFNSNRYHSFEDKRSFMLRARNHFLKQTQQFYQRATLAKYEQGGEAQAQQSFSYRPPTARRVSHDFPSAQPVYTPDVGAQFGTPGRLEEAQRLSKKDESWMWNQRNEQFARAQRQVKIAVTSHLPQEEKCLKLIELFRDAKANGLQFRTQTYEDIFEVLLATPYHADQPFPFIEQLFDMYHYMKGTFAAPSPKLVEYLMSALSRYRTPSQSFESRAHKLMMDADRYTLLPTRYTFSYYFDICGINNVMHIAVSRFVDARDKLAIQPDEGMCTTLIRGLVKNNQVEEAVAFISKMYAVPIDVFLMDAIVEAFAQSADPLAAFSAYRSMLGSGVVPSSYTFWYLMIACERSQHWHETTYVLEQMHRLGIKGSSATLSAILKGLCIIGQKELAKKMYLTMKRQRIPVWETVESALPRADREEANRLIEAEQKKREAKRQHHLQRVSDYTRLAEGDTATTEKAQSDKPKPLFLPKALIPRDEEHLKEFATLGRLEFVALSHLRRFLEEKGVKLPVYRGKGGVFQGPRPFLLRSLVHKHFFGVPLPRRSDKVLPGSTSNEPKGFGKNRSQRSHRAREGRLVLDSLRPPVSRAQQEKKEMAKSE